MRKPSDKALQAARDARSSSASRFTLVGPSLKSGSGAFGVSSASHKMPTIRCPNAFTLMELLVVIAIFGILAALLLPVFSQSKAKAQRIQCVGNLRQFGIGLQTILSSDHGYPLYIENRYNAWFSQVETEGFGISKPQGIYVEAGIWRCPSAQWPASFPAKAARFSYGYNVFGVQGDIFTNFGLGGHRTEIPDTPSPVQESEVKVPADMMAIGESDWVTFERGERYNFPKSLLRHGNVVNVVFCDGHVVSSSLQLLFEDTSDTALSRWNRDHQPHRDKL